MPPESAACAGPMKGHAFDAAHAAAAVVDARGIVRDGALTKIAGGVVVDDVGGVA